MPDHQQDAEEDQAKDDELKLREITLCLARPGTTGCLVARAEFIVRDIERLLTGARRLQVDDNRLALALLELLKLARGILDHPASLLLPAEQGFLLGEQALLLGK